VTKVYFTIATEYEFGFAATHGSDSRAANFARSIAGTTATGDGGIFHQMDVFDRHGLKAVFFVDPMPALVWGTEAIADVVEPIVRRGHDVQLHLHTEWLALAGDSNPLGESTGRNIKEFAREEQSVLLDWGRQVLVDAGAPHPIAFRAGNYGANDDTLRALDDVGMAYSSNHTPGIAAGECAIDLGSDDRAPVVRLGVTEVPIGCIETAGGLRHAQLTALSQRELADAVRHASDTGSDGFTIVSHSFELLSRDRGRINRIVERRFARFCADIAAMSGVSTATYRDDPPQAGAARGVPLPHSAMRSGARMVEQAVGNLLYGAR
jgi:peptidoglycan/xylan/chitin deacetylase (PgdA/CDA1 family)